jgi:hypothetical protein
MERATDALRRACSDYDPIRLWLVSALLCQTAAINQAAVSRVPRRRMQSSDTLVNEPEVD